MDILLTKGAIIENKLGQQWELKGVGISLRAPEWDIFAKDHKIGVMFEFYCLELDKMHLMRYEDFIEKWYGGEIQIVSEGV